MAYIERRITTTLPTTLEPGEEIYYQDANDNLTLWVGHADGTAWPSVGYKEYRAILTIPSSTGVFSPTSVFLDQFGTIALNMITSAVLATTNPVDGTGVLFTTAHNGSYALSATGTTTLTFTGSIYTQVIYLTMIARPTV